MPLGLLAAALALTQSIPLPGVTGGFNHHAADGPRHRIYVCATAHQTVEVVDFQTGKVLKSLPGDKPAAVAYVADYDLLCVSRGTHVQLFDAESLGLIGTVQLPANADELRYDCRNHQLLVGLMAPPHEGIGVIDLVSRELVAELHSSHPQGFALDPNGPRIFVCSPKENAISVLNRTTPSVLTWKLQDAKSCYSIDLDAANHRLFVGCRNPAKLLVLNSDTGAQVAALDIGRDTDDLGYDPIQHQIVVFCGAGDISVIQQLGADRYQALPSLPTAQGARNGGIIPDLGLCYVTVPQSGPEPAILRIYRTPKRALRPPLALARTIPLGPITGRIDHFGYDPTTQRLFVAALGNNSVEVVDLAEGRVVHSIAGLTEPQGLLYLPEFRELYIANGGDGSLRVYDGASYAQVATVKFGDDADNVRYDPEAKRVYVGYGDGAIGIVDPATHTVVGTIPLKAHPESFRLEAHSSRVFINVPRAHTLITADRNTQKVLAEQTPSASSNFPMAVDEPDHRLYVACRNPARLLVYDTSSGKELQSLPMHRDCDDLFYAPMRHAVLATCGEGYFDSFSVNEGAVAPPQSIATAPGARTSCFIQGRLYVAVPRRGSSPAYLLEYR